MTLRIPSKRRILLCLPLALAACEGGVPEVRSQDAVIPEPSPMRQAQSLSAPDESGNGGSSGNGQRPWCKDGELSLSQSFPDGRWITEYTCAPGGGIARVRSEGQSDPATGDGSYDQIAILDDGSEELWHFTVDIAADGSTNHNVGTSDDGSESIDSLYTRLDAEGSYRVETTSSMAEGVYVTNGVQGADGVSWTGTTSFDDPATERSPDWSYDLVMNPDGSGTQTVDYAGEGYTTHYTMDFSADRSSSYDFETDLTSTALTPDYTGAYDYAADGTGTGNYTRFFEDGSTTEVQEVIASDRLLQSWVFDDASTDQAIDQTGEMTWHADGSGEGSVSFHVVDGGVQTCQVRVSADGVQTIDSCS